MLDKSAYYHGAAVIPVLEHKHCRAIRKLGQLGYLVNDTAFVFLKYTTKVRSPWRFTFDQEDVDRASNMNLQYAKVVLGFVCGGDGVCGVEWPKVRDLLGAKPGWIAAARKHNKRYEVWGPESELDRKVPPSRWPGLIFESPFEFLAIEDRADAAQ